MTKYKILVISDSHGHGEKIKKILNSSENFNHIIHCGDGSRDLTDIQLPESIYISRVSGNVDIYNSYGINEETVDIIEGKTVYITHGHQFYVKNSLDRIRDKGLSLGVDIIFYGHTHKPLILEMNPVLFNPGALSENSYGVVSIDEDRWSFEHRILDN